MFTSTVVAEKVTIIMETPRASDADWPVVSNRIILAADLCLQLVLLRSDRLHGQTGDAPRIRPDVVPRRGRVDLRLASAMQPPNWLVVECERVGRSSATSLPPVLGLVVVWHRLD